MNFDSISTTFGAGHESIQLEKGDPNETESSHDEHCGAKATLESKT